MKVVFKYNLEKDIENFMIAKRSLGHGGKPSKLQTLYEEKYGQNMNLEKLREFIVNFSKENKIDFAERARVLQKSWSKVNDEVFCRLEEIFKVQLPTEKIVAYLTINDRCGYNPGLRGQWYFFVNIKARFPKKTCIHEIFHFYTHYCFEALLKEKGLSRQEFYEIKESLTEIINHEFVDLMNAKELGYKEHKEMRQKISELWKKEKDIKKVIDKMIKEMERNRLKYL